MPLSPQNAQLSAKVQEQLGLPVGYKVYSPFPFGTMNQQDSRVGMQDNELYWVENFIKTGNGRMRTLWDHGEPIYTAPYGKTIISFFFFNIAATQYAAVFLNDGTAVQVNVATQAVTTISASQGTFYASGAPLPACCQSGSQYLLLATNLTSNSYWIWDGMILYSAGGIGPEIDITDGGAGYTSVPTVTAFGGSGSGIVVVPSIANGAIVDLQVTNPGTGYLPGETVQFAFSGGGTDSSAILEATISAGAIGSIELVAGGSSYSGGPYALGFSGGGGTGAAGTYTISGGVVTSIELTSGGSGYTGTPTISFPSGGGTGAAAVALVGGGSVTGVNVINGGTNFIGTPTITFTGGGGTGAEGTVTLSGGAISGVTITDGGSGYTSAPAITVETGLNNAAAATASLMPFGVSGTSIENFTNRVWLPYPNQTGAQNNGGTFLVSAPSSLTDFATSDGGLIYTSSDRYLRAQYINIRQSNGYLYPMGDSSVDVISNVQTSGTPPTTTFNYQNTDPQVGTPWRDSCQDYGRTVLFANKLGVYGLYGGAITKVSSKLDSLFAAAFNPNAPIANAVTPSSAVANIYSLKVYMLLMTLNNPISGENETAMVAWNEREWFVISQSLSLTYIGTQEVNSNLSAWGTDGNSIYPLLTTPSDSLQKRLTSKLYGTQNNYITKEARSFSVQGSDQSAGTVGFSFSASILTENGGFPLPAGPVTFSAAYPLCPVWFGPSGDVGGSTLGFDLTTNAPDEEVYNIEIGYNDVSSLFGSGNLNAS